VLVIEHRLRMLVDPARVMDLVREGTFSLLHPAVARFYDRIAQTPHRSMRGCRSPPGRGHLQDHPGACAKRRSALAGHSPRDPSRACARRCRAERADDAFQITKLIRKLLMYLGMGAL
jgi:hypothetical protein